MENTTTITVPVTLPKNLLTPKDVTMSNDIPKRLTYTRDQLAEVLQVSMPVVDALLRRKDHSIPCIRLGANGKGKVLVSVQALNDWLAEETARNSGMTAGKR